MTTPYIKLKLLYSRTMKKRPHVELPSISAQKKLKSPRNNTIFTLHHAQYVLKQPLQKILTTPSTDIEQKKSKKYEQENALNVFRID